MEFTCLGRTNQRISRVAMGGYPLGGHGWGAVDDRQLVAAVQRALDHGVTFFDTADVYGLGRSEELLRRTLGARRRDLVIATKFGVKWDHSGRISKDISPRYLRTALEASLKRLGLECIPLYYVHWPDDKTAIADTMCELIRCREEGKIRWIGVSNFSLGQLDEALSVAEVQALQVQYSLIDRCLAEPLLPRARAQKISVCTWGSLASGLLTGKFNPDSRFGSDDQRSRNQGFSGEQFIANLRLVERIGEIAKQAGKSTAQVAIRWLLDTPGVAAVLFGAKSPAQVDDNTGATGWKLGVSDYLRLDALASAETTT